MLARGLKGDMGGVEEIIHSGALPPDLVASLTSAEFHKECRRKFRAIDNDGDICTYILMYYTYKYALLCNETETVFM